MAVQSVINYLERNRAGLARVVMVEALRACGYAPQLIESPEVGSIRRSIETGLLVAANRPGLQEPQPIEAAQEPARTPDVAGSPTEAQERAPEEEPAQEPEREPVKDSEPEPNTEAQQESQEQVRIPGEEILEERTPPAVPRRRR